VAVWQLADRMQADHADLDREFQPLAAGGGESIEDGAPEGQQGADLSTLSGDELEKAYVESKGKKFGTPSGGTMCTGAYELKSWKPGDNLTAVKNANYWDTAIKPRASSIIFCAAARSARRRPGYARIWRYWPSWRRGWDRPARSTRTWPLRCPPLRNRRIVRPRGTRVAGAPD